MFCPKCGTKNDDGGAFCGSCGNQFPIRQNAGGDGASHAQNRQVQSNQRNGESFAPNRAGRVVSRRTTRRQRGLNKRMLAICGIAIIALIVILAVTLGGDRGGITGTWEDRDGNEWVFSDSSVWIVHNRRDGNSSYIYRVSEGTYFTIDSEIRFYGLDRGRDINHYHRDGNNLFLGSIVLTRVNSNQFPASINPKGITGTWEGHIKEYDGDDYIETLTFSGSSFTTTSYQRIEVGRREVQERQDRDINAPFAIPPPMPDDVESHYWLGSPLSMSGLQTELERNDTTIIKFYTARHYSHTFRDHEGVDISYYVEIDYDIVKTTGRGTFTVTGNKIEFTLSNGSVITRDFFFSTDEVLSIGNSIVTKSETRR